MSGSIQFLERLKNIPYQKIKDSPTVKYYTDWKIFESLLELDYASEYRWETDFMKYSPDIIMFSDRVQLVSDRVSATTITGGFNDYSDVYRREVQFINKMEAYHRFRNNYILKLDFKEDVESYTVVSPSPKGYLPNHLLISVKDNVKVTLNLVDLGLDSGLKTLFLETDVGNNAHLKINYIFIHGLETAAYNEFIYSVGEAAELDFLFLGFGGKMTHIRSNVDLIGKESRGYTYGSLIARGDTKTDVITNVTHHGDFSDSILSVRGGILERGYLVHRGAARILSKSHEANTAVKSYLTIFGEKGTAHSIPMLEVDTGIVAGASHSTSVSRLDEYRIFYLKKMGLSESEIIDLLLRAYVEYSGVAEVYDIDWRALINS